ncbi:alpha/beta fold hydrolase [Fodinisporobacter ferrooxydans]|uniref:Alpha/beta fold hydrolase n=1 Tax=Fodinisporobacter ferrooxydans TaxID=2901836 RepID=A0ABY4CP72_9BACL|nr:alpha/beta fold hydrolase [Alicyclobacillaceae bacterium MYW30-H2]
MATFVICHGAWDGGWFWKEPASELQKLGHVVYRPTFTGLGERKHLGTPNTNLETHIEDILNLFEFEQLDHVFLVGHSYGGTVITGVAERIPEKIQRLVYIDGYVLEDGQSMADLFGDSPLPDQLKTLSEVYGDGWEVPFPSEQRYDSRVSAQPLQTFLQRLEVKNPQTKQLPRTYIACTERGEAPQYGPIAKIAERAKVLGWQYFELLTGHNPNLTMPRETGLLLDRVSKG